MVGLQLSAWAVCLLLGISWTMRSWAIDPRTKVRACVAFIPGFLVQTGFLWFNGGARGWWQEVIFFAACAAALVAPNWAVHEASKDCHYWTPQPPVQNGDKFPRLQHADERPRSHDNRWH